jgi:hypothetical protein
VRMSGGRMSGGKGSGSRLMECTGVERRESRFAPGRVAYSGRDRKSLPAHIRRPEAMTNRTTEGHDLRESRYQGGRSPDLGSGGCRESGVEFDSLHENAEGMIIRGGLRRRREASCLQCRATLGTLFTSLGGRSQRSHPLLPRWQGAKCGDCPRREGTAQVRP